MARDQVDRALDAMERIRERDSEDEYRRHLHKRRALFLGRLVRLDDSDDGA